MNFKELEKKFSAFGKKIKGLSTPVKVIIMVVLGAVIAWGAYEYTQKDYRARIAEYNGREIKPVPDNYVKIPFTPFKPKNQVEQEFKQVGLKAEFVKSDLTRIAEVNKRKVNKDDAGDVEEQVNRKYLDQKEYGDNFGFYAEKGATLYVTYSDVDIDPRKKDKESASSSLSKETKKSESKVESKKTAISESKKSEIDSLNDWYANKFTDIEINMWKDEPGGFYATPDFKKKSVIKGFKLSGDDLIVVISYNRMKAEGLTEEEVASYGFSIVVPAYPGKLTDMDNIDPQTNVIKTGKYLKEKHYIDFDQ